MIFIPETCYSRSMQVETSNVKGLDLISQNPDHHLFPPLRNIINAWVLYLQSKCFFLGPINSSVVALQTDFASPWPARLCLAANNLSFIVCPAIFNFN